VLGTAARPTNAFGMWAGCMVRCWRDLRALGGSRARAVRQDTRGRANSPQASGPRRSALFGLDCLQSALARSAAVARYHKPSHGDWISGTHGSIDRQLGHPCGTNTTSTTFSSECILSEHYSCVRPHDERFPCTVGAINTGKGEVYQYGYAGECKLVACASGYFVNTWDVCEVRRAHVREDFRVAEPGRTRWSCSLSAHAVLEAMRLPCPATCLALAA
jgi:hypothetical protein